MTRHSIEVCKKLQGNSVWRARFVAAVFVSLVAALGSAMPAHAGILDNLLENPGVEDADISMWDTFPTTPPATFPFSRVSGTVTRSGGTVGPSEGSFWFRSEATENGQSFARQTVDVSMFDFSSGTVDVTFGGDAFATAESTITLLRATFAVEFLDAAMIDIDSDQSAAYQVILGDFAESLDFRDTVTVPVGTSFIVFSGRSIASEAGSIEVTLGLDDMFLAVDAEANVIPEPSTFALGILGLFMLSFHGWRRRRR